MRVMVVLNNGTIGHQQDVGPGQAFVVQVQPSDDGADLTWVGDASRVRIGPPAHAVLDFSDRVMTAWAIGAHFALFVALASWVGHWLSAGFLLLAAAGWAALGRKVWRATA